MGLGQVQKQHPAVHIGRNSYIYFILFLFFFVFLIFRIGGTIGTGCEIPRLTYAGCFFKREKKNFFIENPQKKCQTFF